LANPGSPGKMAIKTVCETVHACVYLQGNGDERVKQGATLATLGVIWKTVFKELIMRVAHIR